MVKFNPDLSKS